MKKHILIRILAAMGGVTLWLLCLCALAETFFHLPFAEKIGQLLNAGTAGSVLLILLGAIALGAFGTCCLMMLSSKRASKHNGFVMQKGENGMIGVSVKSIEGLVQTCVKQHDVIASADISVVERRDGIVILLNIEEAAGVNIPLAVGALQKQIKQYVNTCTGVDVREVRVLVDNTEESELRSPYMVEKPMTPAAIAPEQPAESDDEAPEAQVALVEEAPAEQIQTAEEAAAAQEPVAASIANTPVAPVVPVPPAMTEIPEEEDDRPLHQRLFGAEEQPVFVPAPPELVMEPAAEAPADEAAVEAPVEAAEEIPEEPTSADEIDANAVLEVVNAMEAEESGEKKIGDQPEAEDEIHE